MQLIVDNRVSVNTMKASLTSRLIHSFPNAITINYTHNFETIPWDKISCIIFSGSNLRLSSSTSHPVIDFAIKILTLSVKKHIPSIGICFGFQLMAYYLGASIRNRMAVNSVHRSFSRMAGDIMYFNHFDGIYGMDSDGNLLKETRNNQYQNFLNEFSYRPHQWIGIQWHPEKTEKGIDWLKATISEISSETHKS